jgi:hypothetical protein
MGNRSSGVAQTVVPLAPKSNVRSQAGDPLDAAGKVILGLLHRAANTAEANYPPFFPAPRGALGWTIPLRFSWPIQTGSAS